MQLRLLNEWKVTGFLEQHELGLGHESSKLHRKAWDRDAIEAPREYQRWNLNPAKPASEIHRGQVTTEHDTGIWSSYLTKNIEICIHGKIRIRWIIEIEKA